MASSTILILGATGPAGICLLRESLFRKHPTVVYVLEGQMDDIERLGNAVSKASVVISLLGPNGKVKGGEFPYPGYYSAIFPLMRRHSVKSILALATVSVEDTNDKSSFIRRALVTGVKYGFAAGYRTMVGIGRVFQEEAEALNWTVFRVGMVQGEHDEGSWKKDRDDPIFAGQVGETGWTWYIRRGAMAKWLVDRIEDDDDVVGSRTPALSNRKV
ncbi:NmrA family protein [Dactylonectria estremocensis]|uniref:NmrA family protein n=1 Tax=Dactylonectria estremocensis TaxID=1079267 RepID=A0A9P9DHS5_9HYPO|nr:NmrA family protein [Dactylonectria estremocensis]